MGRILKLFLILLYLSLIFIINPAEVLSCQINSFSNKQILLISNTESQINQAQKTEYFYTVNSNNRECNLFNSSKKNSDYKIIHNEEGILYNNVTEKFLSSHKKSIENRNVHKISLLLKNAISIRAP